MISEEYNYDDVSDYLEDNIELLIVGFPGKEEREKYFYEKWRTLGKDFLMLQMCDNSKIHCKANIGGKDICDGIIDLCVGLPQLLRGLSVGTKNVLVDLSSLDHVSIMTLTKQLLMQVPPRSLFATYIRPSAYSHQKGTVGYSLCEKIQAISAVPGFARREHERQTLCAFLGFEGIRLKGVLETVQNVDKLLPIVAFPSGSPQWYNVTIWNNMDMLQNETRDLAINKCVSEGVFEAVDLLRKIVPQEDNVVLAPLGTRAHSMACAIYACEHRSCRIVYDFAVENDERAIGISYIKVYHLSSFIKN